jgi:hypothetical protein
MIVDNDYPYTEDMAQAAAFMLDRLQCSSSDQPVLAVSLTDQLGLEQEQVFGIAEHLIPDHCICFALEDPDCIFSPVKSYWMNGTLKEVAETGALMIKAGEALLQEAEGLRRAAETLRMRISK